MKKTRSKPYIAEDNSSLMYIINPKSTDRGRPAEQEVVLVPRPEGSCLELHILDLLETESEALALTSSPDLVGIHPISLELVGIHLQPGHLHLVFFELHILDF